MQRLMVSRLLIPVLILAQSFCYGLSSRYAMAGRGMQDFYAPYPFVENARSQLAYAMKAETDALKGIREAMNNDAVRLQELRQQRAEIASVFASYNPAPELTANPLIAKILQIKRAIQSDAVLKPDDLTVIDFINNELGMTADADYRMFLERTRDRIRDYVIKMTEAQDIESIVSRNRARYETLTKLGEHQDSIGRVIANGIAGANTDMFAGDVIDSWHTGLKLGVTYKVAQSCGNVIGERSALAAKHYLGGFLDNVLDGISRTIGFINNFIFHGGIEPFNTRDVAAMQELTNRVLVNLSDLVRDGVKDSMRNNAMMLRSDDQQAQSVEDITAWNLLINGYVRLFKRIIGFIDVHATYYPQTSLEYFYATEIKNRLQELIIVLQRSKSVKDLDATVDSNKSIFVAFRQQFANYFELLKQAAQQSAVDNPIAKQNPVGRENPYAYGAQRGREDEGDDYPLRMRGGF